SATSIHGITDLEVSAAPIFSDLAAEMAMIIRGKVFVAHNAPFDASFVAGEYARLSMSSPLGEIADSLLLLRMAYPGLLSYNLGKAAYVLGIPSGQGHRALDDARTCMSLFALSARRLTGLCP
ncbi:MAG: 3'-5' exonuclease, partial [Spirochaetaceae bacterium]|nr:3'-5' exonuclease [Spirochaetaceae bacterium]